MVGVASERLALLARLDSYTVSVDARRLRRQRPARRRHRRRRAESATGDRFGLRASRGARGRESPSRAVGPVDAACFVEGDTGDRASGRGPRQARRRGMGRDRRLGEQRGQAPGTGRSWRRATRTGTRSRPATCTATSTAAAPRRARCSRRARAGASSTSARPRTSRPCRAWAPTRRPRARSSALTKVLALELAPAGITVNAARSRRDRHAAQRVRLHAGGPPNLRAAHPARPDRQRRGGRRRRRLPRLGRGRAT